MSRVDRRLVINRICFFVALLCLLGGSTPLFAADTDGDTIDDSLDFDDDNDGILDTDEGCTADGTTSLTPIIFATNDATTGTVTQISTTFDNDISNTAVPANTTETFVGTTIGLTATTATDIARFNWNSPYIGYAFGFVDNGANQGQDEEVRYDFSSPINTV